MEEKKLIRLYQKRTFSEKFSATVDFIRENWKPLLKYLTYFLLPLAIVQGFFTKSMSSVAPVGNSIHDILNSGVLQSYSYSGIFQVIESILAAVIIYSMMKLYEKRQNRLESLGFGELMDEVKNNIKRVIHGVIGSVLVVILLLLLIALSIPLSSYAIFLTVPIMIVFLVPLSLFVPMTVFEDNDLIGTLSKTYRYGFATWGGTLGLGLMFALVAGILSCVAAVPWYFVYMYHYMMPSFHNVDTMKDFSMWGEIVNYALGVLKDYASFIFSTMVIIAMAYQYGHAADAAENITLDEKINHFDSQTQENEPLI